VFFGLPRIHSAKPAVTPDGGFSFGALRISLQTWRRALIWYAVRIGRAIISANIKRQFEQTVPQVLYVRWREQQFLACITLAYQKPALPLNPAQIFNSRLAHRTSPRTARHKAEARQPNPQGAATLCGAICQQPCRHQPHTQAGNYPKIEPASSHSARRSSSKRRSHDPIGDSRKRFGASGLRAGPDTGR
jgi:hypothetical protein